jgi:hypothetical protein
VRERTAPRLLLLLLLLLWLLAPQLLLATTTTTTTMMMMMRLMMMMMRLMRLMTMRLRLMRLVVGAAGYLSPRRWRQSGAQPQDFRPSCPALCPVAVYPPGVLRRRPLPRLQNIEKDVRFQLTFKLAFVQFDVKSE